MPGLEVSNPLAFLAALGTLLVLSDAPKYQDCRLSWRDEGSWVAVLHGLQRPAEVMEALHADLASWKDELALNLAYDEAGLPVSPDAEGAVFDLRPLPKTLRHYLLAAVAVCAPGRVRSVRHFGAYGSELVTDQSKGRVKPTALHFTSGNQLFLAMVRKLRDGLTLQDFEEALLGPWRNASELPSLSWNAAAPRLYAYRSTNPALEKRGSVPAADWLAFIGLQFFPVAPNGAKLETVCVRGGWNDAAMRWPIWDAPLGVRTVRSLLTWEGLWMPNAAQQRKAMGLKGLYQAQILRDRYGSFSPARVVE
jgi:hypothetical protein